MRHPLGGGDRPTVLEFPGATIDETLRLPALAVREDELSMPAEGDAPAQASAT